MLKPLRALLAAAALWSAFGACAAAAEPPPFDLAGPVLHVTVARAGASLPIAQTPDLAEGDKVTVRLEPPASGASPYLLVLAFLRGATDPPPRGWFTRIDPRTATGGTTVTVPVGARQALVMLAPRTSGDFATAVGAVRGRPGAFVRATQDLTQASLDRSRLNSFLAALRRDAAAGPDGVAQATPLLARSLELKLNADCLQRAPELQAACLLQGRDALILADGHSRSIVEALTGGPANDLAFQLSASPAAGYGATSPYVGAVLDIARLLDSMRTAQFQYIPALGEASGDRLALVLNAAPSFQDPRSVLVAALPPVEAPRPPPLRPVNLAERLCLARDDLVLPATGAPLVFSTAFAHDLRLHVTGADGQGADLPVTADAGRGGLVVRRPAAATPLTGALTGRLVGRWGFADLDGPSFPLQGVRAEPWTPADGDELVVGRTDAVRLKGASACVQRVELRLGTEQAQHVDWKADGADAVTVSAPLTDAKPGPATLLVWQHGADQPQSTPVRLFAQAARADGFTFYAGDGAGVLAGARLDQVAQLSFAGLDFTPGALTSAAGGDELALSASDPAAAARLTTGRAAQARVTLKDGRTLRVASKVRPPRLQVSLISVTRDGEAASGPLKLPAADLPRGAQVTFSLRADGDGRFAAAPSVEVSGPTDAPPVSVTLTHGLTELDARVLVAKLDTAAAFGTSAFGPLRFRVVQDGAAGDWRPLGVLVRTPTLRRLHCAGEARSCELEGDDLYLIKAVSNDPDFRTWTAVAEGYVGRSLAVPHPRADGRIWLHLHDDPATAVPVAF